MSDHPDLFGELPFQRHSKTSRAGAKRPKPARVTAQEKWVYETLRASGNGLTDWQLWRRADATASGLFDKLSSLHRARIGLLWVTKWKGATPYHPVEKSGEERINPESGVACDVWWIKSFFRGMAYERWVERYKALAREKR